MLGQADGSLVQYRSMTVEDVEEVAGLHMRIFPDYFLTHLGQAFLRYLYSGFVEQRDGYGVVAIKSGRIVGFVAGTRNSGAFFKELYRRNLLQLGLLVAGKFLTDPYVRRHIGSRLSTLRHLFGGRSRHPTGSTSRAQARLLSIGVAPDQRGSGIAEGLVGEYCRLLKQDGIDLVGLSVRAENGRAISFYQKNGWHVEKQTDSEVLYVRQTHG